VPVRNAQEAEYLSRWKACGDTRCGILRFGHGLRRPSLQHVQRPGNLRAVNRTPARLDTTKAQQLASAHHLSAKKRFRMALPCIGLRD